VNKKLGKTSAFKSISRAELEKIKGHRPKYERDFHNDFNRYNVKYMDPKIHGATKFQHP